MDDDTSVVFLLVKKEVQEILIVMNHLSWVELLNNNNITVEHGKWRGRWVIQVYQNNNNITVEHHYFRSFRYNKMSYSSLICGCDCQTVSY